VFQALVNALVLDGDRLELTNGTLHVEQFESQNTDHETLISRANDLSVPTIDIEFRTTTCIEEVGDVTTAFPHRRAVFSSLQGKWCQTAPERLEFAISDEDLLAHIIERPDTRSLETQSVLVNRVTDGDGNSKPIFRQGFTGTCSYSFKDASESMQNAVTALALFAEYSGVGSAVARGCGNVTVEVVKK